MYQKIYYLRMSFRKHLLRRTFSSFNSFTRYSTDDREENDIYFQVKTMLWLVECLDARWYFSHALLSELDPRSWFGRLIPTACCARAFFSHIPSFHIAKIEKRHRQRLFVSQSVNDLPCHDERERAEKKKNDACRYVRLRFNDQVILWTERWKSRQWDLLPQTSKSPRTSLVFFKVRNSLFVLRFLVLISRKTRNNERWFLSFFSLFLSFFPLSFFRSLFLSLERQKKAFSQILEQDVKKESHERKKIV